LTGTLADFVIKKESLNHTQGDCNKFNINNSNNKGFGKPRHVDKIIEEVL